MTIVGFYNNQEIVTFPLSCMHVSMVDRMFLRVRVAYEGLPTIVTCRQSSTFSFEFEPKPRPCPSATTYAHPCPPMPARSMTCAHPCPPMILKLRPCIQKWAWVWAPNVGLCLSDLDITLFKVVIVFCRIDNILQNIPHI